MIVKNIKIFNCLFLFVLYGLVSTKANFNVLKVGDRRELFVDNHLIEKLEGFSQMDRNRFIKSSFNQAVELMISWFGEETENWVYGQEDYKHVKIKHPLEEVVNKVSKSKY